ncbi:LuxR C-terminal-related transcriptional regulator [Deinococcus aquatilis]|uniref:LuxR C-terminal-related transcriptional regulator n=1 Tax=Deinococcus aquatilis TaxID=519440 RepID=UPI00038215C6|nr:LuxR C-terminal-related transcriptional regulator [Deinococcus aquatilis]
MHCPPLRPDRVSRPHLTKRLDEGTKHQLTLISAPAGFGKTTLLSEWAAGSGQPVAWLSLDAAESDATLFVLALAAALQTAVPELGKGVEGALRSPQPPSAESALAALLHELARLRAPVVLVLDDYHRIDAKPVDAALLFLLEHLPPTLHLILSTREDPQLPLARWRAQGELTELRAADLRFTATETADFLNGMMGLGLTATHITTLENRTEGWIAGLQLAALSMRGREDVPEFIRRFAGDHRYIVDYLVEEVLRLQPEPVRRFLLETSILDRLCGPLCDAVTEQQGGHARLAALERGNAFVVALDDQRHWFRYHHLFGEVLAVDLKTQQPQQVAALHRRASRWYEQNGLMTDAIRHALAAEDFEHAAQLIELAIPAMRRSRQEATAFAWLEALPARIVRERPVLNVYYAGALVMTGQLEGAEARLLDAERWLDTANTGRSAGNAAAEMVVVDQEEFQGLAGSIALYRAAIALSSGNVGGTLTHARRALELSSEQDHLRRGAAAGLLGLAFWTDADLGAAQQSYEDAVTSLHRAGHRSDAVGCALALAEIQVAQGHLHAAMSTFRQGLQLTGEQGAPVLRGAADMHVGLSQLHHERNELEAAAQHLSISRELGAFAGLPQNGFRWCVVLARLREAEGDLDGASTLLDEAQSLYVSDLFPNVRPIAALKARVWLRQGRWQDALAWAQEQKLSVQGDLSYLREFEHLTLVRLLLAQPQPSHLQPSQAQRAQTDRPINDALSLLDRLQSAAEQGKRSGSVLEILALRALAFQKQGDLPAALALLGRALTLAEPEGYVRVFVDEGAPMTALLRKLELQGSATNSVRQLLSASENTGKTRPTDQGISDPLSERELEVLRLLRSELSGPELARTLSVSLNTLRTHTKNIYSKLGVNTRRAAVRRAEELGLF